MVAGALLAFPRCIHCMSDRRYKSILSAAGMQERDNSIKALQPPDQCFRAKK